MIRQASLAMSAPQHSALKAHLFPGDGKEAAAIMLCSRIVGTHIKLLMRDYILVPHEVCERHPDFLSWPGDYIEQALELSEQDDLSIILLHSHPGGLFAFSDADRASDAIVIPAVFAGRAKCHKDSTWHGSAIMLEDGAMRVQLYDDKYCAMGVDMIGVYGDDLRFFWNPERFGASTSWRPMAFSGAMSDELSRLSVCIVGVSGTGSIVAEQLARLGFGQIILIDYDHMEEKNLNRILNSSLQDAQSQRLKVDVLSTAIRSYRPKTLVKVIPARIDCRDSILEAAMADLVFCCVDSDVGRQICDLMASAFLQPLFDVGVTIPVRSGDSELPSILDVIGRIDYVWPGGSTLADREVFTPGSIAAENLARIDTAAHAARVREGYMPGSHEEAPSVISLNMRAGSASVMEFIARAFPFRHDPNALRTRTLFSLAACEEEYIPDTAFARKSNVHLGQGMKRPLLGLPLLES